MSKFLFPYLTQLLSSDAVLKLRRSYHEIKRVLNRQQATVRIFLRVNDPYSYLVVQTLQSLQERFDINIEPKVVLELQNDMYPDIKAWQKYAFDDAKYLSQLYQFLYPDNLPVWPDALIQQATIDLVSVESHSVSKLLQIFNEFWNESYEPKITIEDQQSSQNQLIANQKLLKTTGHYLTAMFYYGGEWYWGLDRLDHLEKRLYSLGLCKDNHPEIVYQKTYQNFCQLLTHEQKLKTRHTQPLVMYFSIRSPYSYLGLQRVVKLARFYNIPLKIKPILPMVMRGLLVPKTKKMYIFHDTKRETKKLGIEYGKIADPLGKAVGNCYSLFEYAVSENKEIDYLLSFAEAVNAQGIWCDNENGVKVVVERCGLDWEVAKNILEKSKMNSLNQSEPEWSTWAEKNRQELLSLGLWGVPCFRYGDLVVWGQDRLCRIEQAIVDSIETL